MTQIAEPARQRHFCEWRRFRALFFFFYTKLPQLEVKNIFKAHPVETINFATRAPCQLLLPHTDSCAWYDCNESSVINVDVVWIKATLVNLRPRQRCPQNISPFLLKVSFCLTPGRLKDEYVTWYSYGSRFYCRRHLNIHSDVVQDEWALTYPALRIHLSRGPRPLELYIPPGILSKGLSLSRTETKRTLMQKKTRGLNWFTEDKI